MYQWASKARITLSGLGADVSGAARSQNRLRWRAVGPAVSARLSAQINHPLPQVVPRLFFRKVPFTRPHAKLRPRR